MVNIDRLLNKSLPINWVLISSEIARRKTAILAISFYFSSPTRSRNFEKKLINFLFRYRRFLSFVAAVYSR